MTKLCIFTSTRADYGILSPLIKLLKNDSQFEVRLFVTGTHYIKEHGLTIDEITKDGHKAHYGVQLKMHDDAQTAHLKIMGEGISEFATVLAKDKPDAALVLGDRYEALAFGIAANGLGIPLIHLHGGEVTEGALDEVYRHCLTKLSNLHFVAAEKYKQRVVHMGENPHKVFNVGALGIDNVKNVPLLDRKELSTDLKIKFKEEVLAVTYHPETSNPELDKVQMKSLLDVLKKKVSSGKTTLIFTRANADHGNEEIHKMVEKFTTENSDSSLYVQSLGMKRYLSLVKIADAVVGNSSSGIIEAPAMGTPTVDIGDRQKGRERAESIFHVAGKDQDIDQAIENAIKFKKNNSGKSYSVYGDGNAALRIQEVLRAQTFIPYPKKEFFNGLEKV